MSPAKPTKKRTASRKKEASPGRTAAKKGPHAEAIATISELAKLAKEHGLSEVSIETKGISLKVKRGGSPVVTSAVSAVAEGLAPAPPLGGTTTAAEREEDGHAITSPFVGTFYRSPGPDAEPYVSAGDRVEAGQVLCIVEAMKLMNEIEADTAGVVASVLVENAEAVEYGQALFRIVPS